MYKPSLQEVKEYFKNAKEVKSLIRNYKGELDLNKIYYNKYFNEDVWCPTSCGLYNIMLFNETTNQYAEIISYKEPLYQLTAKEIVHAYENPQYLKDTFKECFVPEYTISEAESKFNIKIKAD